VAAHLATADEVGGASAVISAMQLIGTFGTVGLNTLLIAEGGRRRIDIKTLVVTGISVASCVAVLGAVGYATAFHILLSKSDTLYRSLPGTFLFALGAAITAATIVLDGALVGLLRGSRQLWRNTVFSITKLLLLPVAAVTIGASAATIYAVWFAGNVVSVVALWARLRDPWTWFLTRPSRRALHGLGRAAAGHHWVNVASQLPRLVLPIVVATQLSNEANAAFYAALLLVSFVWIVPNHLATAIFAVNAHNPSQLQLELRTVVRIAGAVSILAAVGTPLLARPLLAIFGRGYEQAQWCLVALAAATFASAAKSIYIAVRRTQGALGRAAWAAIFGTGLELLAAEVGLKLAGLTGVGIGFGAAMSLEVLFYWPRIWAAQRSTGDASDCSSGDRQPWNQHNDVSSTIASSAGRPP
jgi:O-antigen/teichoic acid export membrane protein